MRTQFQDINLRAVHARYASGGRTVVDARPFYSGAAACARARDPPNAFYFDVAPRRAHAHHFAATAAFGDVLPLTSSTSPASIDEAARVYGRAEWHMPSAYVLHDTWVHSVNALQPGAALCVRVGGSAHPQGMFESASNADEGAPLARGLCQTFMRGYSVAFPRTV